MNDGGPAFPVKGGMIFYFPESAKDQIKQASEEIQNSYDGMTLRDYFAGQVLNRLAADESITWEQTALMAYDAADAMLKARKQTND